MSQFCPVCHAEYPAKDEKCTVCKEPSQLWEAREREKLLIGYESARPFELPTWTGVPRFEPRDPLPEGDPLAAIRSSLKQGYSS